MEKLDIEAITGVNQQSKTVAVLEGMASTNPQMAEMLKKQLHIKSKDEDDLRYLLSLDYMIKGAKKNEEDLLGKDPEFLD
ncbi:MAG: hypothetical protein Q7K40_03545 [bacterium]|nr:hypothetical protein [bacterium]